MQDTVGQHGGPRAPRLRVGQDDDAVPEVGQPLHLAPEAKAAAAVRQPTYVLPAKVIVPHPQPHPVAGHLVLRGEGDGPHLLKGPRRHQGTPVERAVVHLEPQELRDVADARVRAARREHRVLQRNSVEVLVVSDRSVVVAPDPIDGVGASAHVQGVEYLRLDVLGEWPVRHLLEDVRGQFDAEFEYSARSPILKRNRVRAMLWMCASYDAAPGSALFPTGASCVSPDVMLKT